MILNPWTCVTLLFIVKLVRSEDYFCGCHVTRGCYKEMLDTLKTSEETACIEESSGGMGTMLIYFKALETYCGTIITVKKDKKTFEERDLYEIVIHNTTAENQETKPVILLEAGQEAGVASTDFALFLIEQLMGCQENNNMILKAKWVILPATNPDGQEMARFRSYWKKNCRLSEDKFTQGVDISRNFDSHWSSCENNNNAGSLTFQGQSPVSENETIFIKDTITKYKADLKAYVSIRRDGHGIYYPYSNTRNNPSPTATVYRVAGDIAIRVNQRATGVRPFTNSSIYDANYKAKCGSSVDLVQDMNIPLSFEMRVFFGSDASILSKYQNLPRGYENSLRMGYFAGIKELYDAVVNEKKYSSPANRF